MENIIESQGVAGSKALPNFQDVLDGTVPSPLKRKRVTVARESSERLNEQFNVFNAQGLLESRHKSQRRALVQETEHSTEWWDKTADVLETNHQIMGLKNKASFDEVMGDSKLQHLSTAQRMEQWANDKTVRELRKQMKYAVQAAAIARKKAERTKNLPVSEQTWWQDFLKSLGLIEPTKRFQVRNRNQNRKLREAAVRLYAAQNPKNKDFFHCPILNKWIRGELAVKVAHIFPCDYGKAHMATIFGTEAAKEMYNVKNVLVMSREAEEAFDLHYFSLVPDVADDTDQAQVKTWLDSEPRAWRVNVFEDKSEEAIMTKDFADLDGPPLTLASRHGKLVAFQSDARPRGRYLYFKHGLSVMKNRGPDAGPETITEDGGKLFFGSAGSYLGRSFLTGMVEYMGHQYVGTPPEVPEEDQEAEEEDKAKKAAAMNMLLRQSWVNPDKAEKIRNEEEQEQADLREKKYLEEVLEETSRTFAKTEERLKEVNARISNRVKVEQEDESEEEVDLENEEEAGD